MPFAARLLDATNHPGMISGPGVATVLIENMPAAVVGDMHTCAFPPLAGPHPPNPILNGSATVMIGGRPAARLNDPCGCGAMIVTSAATVVIG
jgi:uncharacterized Zn-binding protein involved in type VI secretion